MSEPLRALIMAGGTGGHVFPALAVAKVLKGRGVDIQWLGTQRGIESTLVPAADIPLHCIDVEGVRGKGKLSLLLAPVKLAKALWQARRVVKVLQPDVVVGFGGFASGPGGFMAKLLGIPLLIHEQNAIAGTTNKILRPLSSKVMQAFPAALQGATTVGNPVREDIVRLQPSKLRIDCADSRVNLLIIGGSLGAKAINELLPEALALMPSDIRPHVWHQTGRAHLDVTQASYKALGITNARVDAFVEDMAAAYSWADIVLCRAGALTVSELSAAGLGGVLIPYPWAIDDHQTKNAEVLVNADAAILCRQEGMTAQNLEKILSPLIKDKGQLLQMAENARRLAQPNAADDVANACMELIKNA